MSKPILYSFWRSSTAWRVRIALALKGVDYEYRAINVIEGEARAPDFAKLNPTKRVPLLVLDGKSLCESLAIVEFIDEKFPSEPLLLPNDPFLKAKARAIALHVTANIQPMQNVTLVKDLNKESPGKGTAWAVHWISVGLEELEALLRETAGQFAVGDSLSVADLVIPSMLFNARLYNIDLNRFPILTRLDSSLAQIPAFKRAHANAQPDAPKN